MFNWAETTDLTQQTSPGPLLCARPKNEEGTWDLYLRHLGGRTVDPGRDTGKGESIFWWELMRSLRNVDLEVPAKPPGGQVQEAGL